jgi:hypothetical protein
MSYDLMVFEPEVAPKKHAAFMAWYFKLVEWNDEPYNDPTRTTERLRLWVRDMQRTFPDMNTPEAEVVPIDDDGVLSDYTIGRDFVYAGFAWSKAIAAAAEAERLAKLHGVGFFDVSSNGEEVYLPVNGRLELAHQKVAPSFLERMKRKFGGG